LAILAEELKAPTRRFAVRIVRLFRALPKTDEARVLGKQVLRSGTSVGANYRAACRARSKAEFTAKMGLVVEECDETVFWLELLIETGIVRAGKLTSCFVKRMSFWPFLLHRSERQEESDW